MAATTLHKTRVHFNEYHYCITHSETLDKTHINTCSLFEDLQPITKYVEILERQDIYENDEDTLHKL